MRHAQQYQPENAFLDTLREAAQRNGRRYALNLVSELDRLSSSRSRWRPQQAPSASYLGICLSRAPKETAALCGSISALRPHLCWKKAPSLPQLGSFNDRHAYTTLVGPEERIPSSRIMVGLFLVDPSTYYPPHAHSAEEIYLPLSGTALYGVGDKPPKEASPGTFMRHKPWEAHTMWTSGEPVLILWVWMGDIGFNYKVLGD